MQNAIRWVLLCAAAAFFTVEIARADSPVIWSGTYAKSLAASGFMQKSGEVIASCQTDPSTGGGFAAPVGSMCQGPAGVYIKTGPGNTDWGTVPTADAVWLLAGNAGTTAGTDFIGTTDAQDVVFKRNSSEKLRLGASYVSTQSPLLLPEGAAGTGVVFAESGNDTNINSPSDGQIDTYANGVLQQRVTQTQVEFPVQAKSPLFIPVQVGTQAADTWSTIVNGITVDSYALNGTMSSILNYTPIDGVSPVQKSSQTNLNPSASTTTANFTGRSDNVGYDGSNAGYDFAGNIVGYNAAVSHGGSGHVGFMSGVGASASFTNGGTTDLAKVANVSAGVNNATVTSLNNVGSYINASQWTGQGRAYEVGAGMADSTLTSFDGIGGNVNVTGASTVSGNVTGIALASTIEDTTAANQVVGINLSAQAIDDTVIQGATGIQNSVTLQNNAAASGQSNASYNSITLTDASSSNGVTAVTSSVQASGSGSLGGVVGLSNGISLQGSKSATSVQSLYSNSQLTGSNVVANMNGIFSSISAEGTSDVDNLTGAQIEANLKSSATGDTITGLRVNAGTNNSAALSSTLQGAEINLSTNDGTTVTQAQGLKVNMNGVTLSPAALAGGAQKVGLSVEDGALNASYGYHIPSAASFFQQHYIGGSAIVDSGTPVSAFGFGTNLAQTVALSDDWTLDGSGLGYVDVGFVGSIGIDAGKTMARWTGALGGAGNPSGSGTITDAIMFRAAGILPQGGSVGVTNMYGFQVDPNLFGLVGTNKWGFYEAGGVENAMSKLAIGTATNKVANSDTALEIGGARALLNGRGTTAEKNALTAVAGMQFFDTDLGELQWYDGSNWILATGTPLPTFSAGSVIFSNGTTLTEDNANFNYDDATGLLKIGNGVGASTAGVRAYSDTEKQFQIYDTVGGGSNWSIGASGGNFYMEKGGGPFFIKAYAGIQLWGGSGVPRWAVVGSFTDNSTSVSDIIPGGSVHDVPVFVAQNTNTTANNYSGWVTSAGTAGSMSTTQADTAILGIHESHTVGSETGHLEFYVQDSGAGLVKALNLAKDKTVTMPAYGAGAAVFNSSGVLSSVAPGTSGNVLTSNGTTWVSSPSSGGGTVTSVGMTVPSFLSVSGSPVTTSGTLAVSLSGTALPVANGGTGQTSYTDGQLLIGNSSGNTLTKSTLTAGSGITITNGGGSITIASSGGGCSQPVLTKTSDYTVLTGDFTCANKTLMVECNGSSPMTITLPAASNTGYEVDVVNVGSATCTVASAGGDTFGSTADTTLVLPPSGNFPQVGQQLKANGGTRWNGW